MLRINSVAKVAIVLLLLCVVFIPSVPVYAQEMSSEMLLFAEIPTVISAARKEQPLNEAPAFVSVITADDIRQSGAQNLPDALKSVPGISVMRLGYGDPQIGIRGFTHVMSDKVLALVDGRTMYLDFYNTVLWPAATFILEDVDRVEIVEGPASTLYGANACTGVINVITKSPEQAKGTYISSTFGGFDLEHHAVVHANAFDKWGYKIAGMMDRIDQSHMRNLDGQENESGSGQLRYNIDEDKKLDLRVAKVDIDYINLYDTGIFAKGKNNSYQLDYTEPNFYLRFYRNDMATQYSYLGIPFSLEGITYVLEGQGNLSLNEKNSLILGGNMQRSSFETAISHGGKITLMPSSIYAQEVFNATDKLTLYTGGLLNFDDIAGRTYFSPRVAGVYKPQEEHVWRLSWSQGMRTPSIQEAFGTMALPGLWMSSLLFDSGEGMTFLENPSLKPAVLTTTELGYQGKFSSRTKGFGNLYYSTLKRNIEAVHTNWNYPLTLFGFPHPFATLPSPFAQYVWYTNAAKYDSWGTELGLEYLFTDWLTGMVNYSYNNTENKSYDYTSKICPQNMANLGLKAKWKNGLNANLLVHYVGSTEWRIRSYADILTGLLPLPPFNETAILKAESYTTVDLRLGYRFYKDSAEIAVIAENIFDEDHYEYPAPDLLQNQPFAGQELGRIIKVNFSFKF